MQFGFGLRNSRKHTHVYVCTYTFNNKADYIDSACDFTYIEFYLNLNEVEKQTNSNVSLDTYNETTGKIECHNRLIKSNANHIILNNSNENFAIAFGVFEDFENLERAISFNLVFCIRQTHIKP